VIANVEVSLADRNYLLCDLTGVYFDLTGLSHEDSSLSFSSKANIVYIRLLKWSRMLSRRRLLLLEGPWT